MKHTSLRQSSLERLTIVSSHAFADVLTRFTAQIAHPDVPKLMADIRSCRTDTELEVIVSSAVGPPQIMEFARFDLGEVLRKESGGDTPRAVRLLVGNPLTMRKMARHVPDAGSYAPATVLFDERTEGVYIYYDRMASLLASYRNGAVLEVARDLDSRIEGMLIQAAG